MELDSKPASDASISGDGGGDYYIAQADDISIDGGKIHGGEANNSNNELFQNSRLKSLRLINTLSYLLTTVTILSTIHTTFYGNDDEYDNYTDWMANQTLLSVAPYTRYIWYVLCALQALFVGAAFMEGLQMNVLLGYTALAESQEEQQEANSNNSNLTSPVVHYPALCASGLLMIYSVKLNIMSCALLGSCLTTYFLVNIIKFQLLNTNTVATDASTTSKKEWIQQYICIQLPFELYAGYNLGLNIMFLNIVLRKLIPNAITFDVFLAAVSLVSLLIVGCHVTWKEKRLYYGVGGGLVWYLLGVYFQLVYLSTPIMTTYSSEVIPAIKYMAVIFANIILSAVVLRAAKNYINMRIVCGSGMDDVVNDEEEEGESEEELEASYTHV